MNKIKNFTKEYGVSIASLVITLAASAQSAFAQDIPPAGPAVNPSSPPQGQITSIQGILNTVCIVFDWMFYFLIALAVIFIIVAAFKYLLAGGDAEKIKGAGSTLIYAAVAVGVALLARAIPLIVASFLGASGNIGAC
jgi:uncharacterized membrane protein YagU involved in acid resistance